MSVAEDHPGATTTLATTAMAKWMNDWTNDWTWWWPWPMFPYSALHSIVGKWQMFRSAFFHFDKLWPLDRGKGLGECGEFDVWLICPMMLTNFQNCPELLIALEVVMEWVIDKIQFVLTTQNECSSPSFRYYLHLYFIKMTTFFLKDVMLLKMMTQTVMGCNGTSKYFKQTILPINTSSLKWIIKTLIFHRWEYSKIYLWYNKNPRVVQFYFL